MDTLKIKNEQTLAIVNRLRRDSADLLTDIQSVLINSSLSEFWTNGLGRELMGSVCNFIILSAVSVQSTNENGYLVEIFLEARTFTRRGEIMDLKDTIKAQLQEEFGISIARFQEDHGSTIYIAM